ncbi:MAG: GNAT family N-acetyltransferase [Gemmatimonadales bacterium]|nr:GNAT family N-acetyltransferase [Gemmatimonadales bacterium]
MRPEELTLRDLTTHEDYDQCVALQEATWGEGFQERVPPGMLMVAQKVGGLAVGAFDRDGALVAFVYGLTGIKDGRLTHWSHMLAVRDDLRGRGIGQHLKLHQRDRLRELGVDRILWTFDPLVARNAHLNLNRLGARVIEYVEDVYVEDPRSRPDRLIGTDRVIVEWDIAGTPHERAGPPPASTEAPIVSSGDPHAPPLELPAAPRVWVEVPENIHRLQQEKPNEAVAWRATTRRAFRHYLGLGYAVVGFARRPDTQRCFYTVHTAGRPGA